MVLSAPATRFPLPPPETMWTKRKKNDNRNLDWKYLDLRGALYARARDENKHENRIHNIESIENRLKTNCAAENAERGRDEEEINKK